MNTFSFNWFVALSTAFLMCLLIAAPVSAKEKDLDICSLVSKEQLAGVYKKPLFPTTQRRSCFWSEEPGAMAYLHISLQKNNKPLRDHFFKDLPEHVELVKINKLGDDGLMGISKGKLELILITKKQVLLKSNVTFLDIEQGSKKQENLWKIYRTILREM